MGLVMRIGALVTAVGVLLAALAAEALAASDIRSVRLWRAPDNTRLVFDLSGPVQHSVFTLAAPDRIVIDVSGAKLATSLEQLSLANTPITGVRSAQRSADDLRVVIDLSAPVSPKSFTLAPNQQYGHRLVVDLFDQGSAPPSAPTSSVAASAPPVPVTPTQPPPKLTPVPNGKRDIVIAIDAGHGGEDPGALSPVKGQYEKNVTLAISRNCSDRSMPRKAFAASWYARGLLHSTAQAHRDCAQEGRGSVRVHSCRCSAARFGLRCVGLCLVRARSNLRDRSLAGRCREPV